MARALASTRSLAGTRSGPGGTRGLVLAYYTTNFPLTENPMLENGVWGGWIAGATVGLDWSNMRTVGGQAYGTQDGNQGAGVFNDSVTQFSGPSAFGPNQRVQARVFNNLGAGGDYFSEVELHLQCKITSHSVQTYEIGFGLNPHTGGHYTGISRWNGAIGSVSTIAATITIAPLVTGDTILATISGGVVTGFINGSQVIQGTDSSALTGGVPGIGHWLHNQTNTGDPTQYGFTSVEFQSQ